MNGHDDLASWRMALTEHTSQRLQTALLAFRTDSGE
jgi:hypothetical protein